ncbi:MAG: hypothetical protein ACE37K_06255 [Planctomycetota bacterium]
MRDVADRRLDGHRHLAWLHAAFAAQGRAAALDRRQAAREVRVLEPKEVEDRRRRHAFVGLCIDDRQPSFDR